MASACWRAEMAPWVRLSSANGYEWTERYARIGTLADRSQSGCPLADDLVDQQIQTETRP
jgi:hypothetical protein